MKSRLPGSENAALQAVSWARPLEPAWSCQKEGVQNSWTVTYLSGQTSFMAGFPWLLGQPRPVGVALPWQTGARPWQALRAELSQGLSPWRVCRVPGHIHAAPPTQARLWLCCSFPT